MTPPGGSAASRHEGTIIDFHNHLGRDVDGHEQHPSRLLDQMAAADVSHAVVFPFDTGESYGPWNQVMGTWSADGSTTGRRLIGFGRVAPSQEEWREALKGIPLNHLKGVKLHPRNDRFDLDSIPEAWDALADLGLPVLFHSGDKDGRWVQQMEKVVARYDGFPIIFGHAGLGSGQRDACRLAREHDHVWLEISINQRHQLEYLIASAGAENLLFGSDTPYVDMLEMRQRLEGIELLTGKDLERIYWTNAVKVLGGVVP